MKKIKLFFNDKGLWGSLLAKDFVVLVILLIAIGVGLNWQIPDNIDDIPSIYKGAILAFGASFTFACIESIIIVVVDLCHFFKKFKKKEVKKDA